MSMEREKKTLLGLPLTGAERQWLTERLETLSVKEEYQLAAAVLRTGKLAELAEKEGVERLTAVLGMKPEVAVDAVNCLLTLHDYEVCYPVSSHEGLGAYYLRHELSCPNEARPFADLEQLGQYYEDLHPGVFVGNCYVAYPARSSPRLYDGTDLGRLQDNDWSLRLKLASPHKPEGVWLRLPDYSAASGKLDEVALALKELGAVRLEECTLLEARCVLPEIGDLTEQYDDLEELVRDGDDLGYVLDEQGQGMPHFMEKFTAAMELEHCRDLRLALDISQNLHCYEWVPNQDLTEMGRHFLHERKGSEELLRSGCFDAASYALDVLDSAGYVLTNDERGFIARNDCEFQFDRAQPRQGSDLTMN